MYAAKLGKSIEMEKRKGGGKYEELPLLECSFHFLGPSGISDTRF